MNAKTILIGLFVTCLVTAQVLGSKLVLVTLPVIGAVAMPAGTFAYAGTFFATDTLGELYGKGEAKGMVNAGFLMNFVLLALVWAAISLPAARGGIDPAMFETVLGAGTNIVLGSLTAYVVSQHIDVSAFHYIRARTGGRHLWLRNLTSTSLSQFVDTAIFSITAFAIAPVVLGIGASLPPVVVWSIIVGQFIVKVLIALVDTPLVYAAVAYTRSHA